MKYKLKEHVTDEMLVNVGFDKAYTLEIDMKRITPTQMVYITHDRELFTWFEEDLKDLIDLDYVEVEE